MIERYFIFDALTKIFVCLAVACWIFACVRLFKWPPEGRPVAERLAVITFTLQLVAAAISFFFFRSTMVEGSGSAILFSLEASLSIMAIIWSFESGSRIGNRIKAAVLLWIFSGVFAALNPSMTS
jgi:hypothetical protein